MSFFPLRKFQVLVEKWQHTLFRITGGKGLFFTNVPGIINHSLQNSNQIAPEVSPTILVDPCKSPHHKPHPSATTGKQVPKLHPLQRYINYQCLWRYHAWHERRPIMGMAVRMAAEHPGRNDQCIHS